MCVITGKDCEMSVSSIRYQKSNLTATLRCNAATQVEVDNDRQTAMNKSEI